ncbi:MAG: hypothetical protein ABSE99_00570 [Terracidiphilus sp.]
MRRGLSIFLILFFWLGPLAATLPGSDQSRLPPCCRRHGAHHCAMAMRMAAAMAQAASGKPVLTAPSQCPLFPAGTAAPAVPVHALAVSSLRLPVPLAQAHSPAAARAVARLGQIRTRAGRGPPASLLS